MPMKFNKFDVSVRIISFNIVSGSNMLLNTLMPLEFKKNVKAMNASSESLGSYT